MRLNRTLFYPLLLMALFLVNLFSSRIATLQQADANTYNEQGLALMASEKFEEAVVAFAQAIKIKKITRTDTNKMDQQVIQSAHFACGRVAHSTLNSVRSSSPPNQESPRHQ